MRILFSIALILLPFILRAQVFDVYPVLETGPPDERIDIVILGDGYTADEQDKMEADAEAAMARLFDEEVFAAYRNFFNIILIKAVSEESGANHPGTAFDEPSAGTHPVKAVNNYFGSSFDRGGTHRAVMPSNYTAVYSVLSANYPQYDNILVMVNTTYYGGAASGRIAAFTLHPSAPLIALHELGHSLGRVADEYDYGRNSAREAPNATSETRREFIRWNHWIEDSTPIPTPENFQYADIVGLFEGAVYQPTGWYRPELNCMMRALGYDFCSVCEESLVINFYQYATPIVSVFPDADELIIDTAGELSFGAEVIEMENPTFQYRWLVDGVEIAEDNSSLTLEVDKSPASQFTVTLAVQDTTPLVRVQDITATKKWVINGLLKSPVIQPEISSFYPETGTSGDTIFIQGTSFSSIPGNNVVTVNDIALEVLQATGTELQVRVPPVYLSGRVAVEVLNNKDSSEVEFNSFVQVSKIEPTAALPGDTLTIFGNNFSSDEGWNAVSREDCEFEVVEADYDRIRAIVPACIESSFIRVGTKNTDVTDSIYFRLATDTLSGPEVVRDWQFGGNLQDSTFRMIRVSQGGYLAGATIENEGTGMDYWVAFFDDDMQMRWERIFGGSGDDVLTDIEESFNGGFVITGYSSSKAFKEQRNEKSENSLGPSDFWVLRLDPWGYLMWERSFGGTGSENENYLACMRDGTITIGGSSNSDVSGDRTAGTYGQYDFWVLNVDDRGRIIFDYAFGGNRDDRIAGICKGPSGDIILSGKSSSDASGSKSMERKGFNDLWVISVTGEGQINWDRTIGGSKRELGGYLRALDDGRFLIAGSSNSPEGDGKESSRIGGFDYWVVELDNDGETLNEASFGTTADDILTELDFLERNDRVYLGGYTTGGEEADKGEINYGGTDYWFLALDRGLNKIWDRGIGGLEDDYLSEIQPLSSRHLFVGGTSSSGIGINKTTPYTGSTDIWLVELADDEMDDDDLANPYVNIEDEIQLGGTNKDHLGNMLTHPDGSVYIAGYSKSRISGNKETQGKGLYDFWLIKRDETGNKLWEKVYGGNHNDILTKAIFTSDGNILLAGSSHSTPSGDVSESSRGEFDYWLIKIDPEGSILWERRYGGNRTDMLGDVIELEEGGFLIGGTSNSDKTGDKTEEVIKWGGGGFPDDYWVLRLDSDGNVLWDRTLGGNGVEELRALAQDNSGDLYVGGTSRSYEGGYITDSKFCLADQTWIAKLDKNGNFSWGKSIGYSDSEFGECYEIGDIIVDILPLQNGNIQCFSQIAINVNQDPYLTRPVLMRYELTPEGSIRNESYTSAALYLEDVLVNPAGGYYASMRRRSSIYSYYQVDPIENYGMYDYVLAKLDFDFNILWQTAFGGSLDDRGTSLALSTNGQVLLGGTSMSGSNPEGSKTLDSFGEEDIWILEISDKQIKTGEDSLVTSLPALDGGYFLAGNSTSRRSISKSGNSKGGSDYWIRKFDAENNQVWDKTLGGSQDDYLTDIHELSNGHIAVAGYSRSNRSGDKTSNRSGPSDLWVVMLDESGTILWDRSYGGTGTETGGYIHENSDGGLLIGGNSDSPRSGDKLQPSEDPDYWLIKTNSSGRITWERTWQQEGEQRMTDLVLLRDDEIAYTGIDRSTEVDYFRYNQKGWRRNAVEVGMDDPHGRFMILERESDVVIAGTHRNSYGDLDYTAVAFEEWGDIRWRRNYGGLGDEVLSSVTASENNGFLLSGTSQSAESKDRSFPSGVETDIWIADVSTYGYKIWDDTVNFSPTSGGGFTLYSNDQLIVSGTSDDGGLEFARQVIDAPDYPDIDPKEWILNLGMTGLEGPSYVGQITMKVIPTGDGGNIVIGNSVIGEGGYKTSPEPGIWILRTTAAGLVEWDRTLAGSADDFLVSIVSHKDGYFIGTNSYYDPDEFLLGESGDNTINLYNIDEEGYLQWKKQIMKSDEYLLNMTTGSNKEGTLLATSHAIHKLDATGTISWQEYFGTEHPEYNVLLSTFPTEGYYVAPWGSGNIQKYDSFGNILLDIEDIPEQLNAISRANNGGIFALYNLYLDEPDPFAVTYIRKLNRQGEEVWGLQNREFTAFIGFRSFTKGDLGFVLFDLFQYAEFDNHGTFIHAGETYEEFRYLIADAAEKDSASYVMLLHDGYDFKLAAKPYSRLIIESLTSQDISTDPFSGSTRLYPNPAREQLWIGGEDIVPDQVEIRDLAGREYRLNIRHENGRIRVETSPLAAGIYLLTVRSAEGNETYRFVKE